MNWIKVTDSLPRSGQDVLLWKSNCLAPYVTTGFLKREKDGTQRWFHGKCGEDSLYYFTHWMEFSKGPEEDNNGL